LTLHYSDLDIAAAATKRLHLLRWQDGAWQDPSPGCGSTSDYTHNLDANLLTAPICQAGEYALFVPAYRLPAPCFRQPVM
jgi:hypothetical protein